MEPKLVTREELYAQVWETPMYKLAASYGISGNGLAKICDRLEIPYPPRGYWARKAAGQSVVVDKLPERRTRTPANVRIAASAPKVEPSLPSLDIAERIARLQERRGGGASAGSRRHHPVIAGWISQHAERVRGHRESRYPFSIAPRPISDVDRRQHRLLSDLLWLLERAGGKLEDRELGNIACIMEREPVVIQVREKSRQAKLQPPPGLKPGASYYPKTELRPTGLLVLTIKTRIPGGMRHEWVEKEEEPLGDRIAEIASVIVAAGPLLVEERRQREEQERLRQIEEQRRHEEQQRRRADRNRWRRFLELAARHGEAERARTLLSTLLKSEFDPAAVIDGRPISEWVQWTRSWIERHDVAVRGPASVFKELADVSAWTYHDN